MGKEDFYEAIKQLVKLIKSVPRFVEAPDNVKTTDDEVVASIINHTVNAKHLIRSTTEAFNGAEQFMALKAAQQELEELNTDLFRAKQSGMLKSKKYDALLGQTHYLIDLLSDFSDPEYN